MRLWNFKKKNKDGWYRVLSINFPSMTFWGILTIIGMIGSANLVVQVASTIFLITGIFKLGHERVVNTSEE